MSQYDSLPISQLPLGTVQGTDVFPATDTTDLIESPSGTTKKYTVANLVEFTKESLELNMKNTCLVATTGNFAATYENGSPQGVGATLTATSFGALSFDGVSMTVGDRVLVAFQSTASQNGIYVVTTVGDVDTLGVLTRASDYTGEAPDFILKGDVIPVLSGTLYALTFWFQTSEPVVINVDAITFQLQNNVSTFDWVNQTTTPVNMAVNTGYTSSHGATPIDFNLPASSAIGSYIEITGHDSGLFNILQASGQQIHFGSASTTLGVSGSISSNSQYSNITLRCIAANTIWTVTSFVGDFTTV